MQQIRAERLVKIFAVAAKCNADVLVGERRWCGRDVLVVIFDDVVPPAAVEELKQLGLIENYLVTHESWFVIKE